MYTGLDQIFQHSSSTNYCQALLNQYAEKRWNSVIQDKTSVAYLCTPCVNPRRINFTRLNSFTGETSGTPLAVDAPRLLHCSASLWHIWHVTDKHTDRQKEGRFGSRGLIIGYKNNTKTVSRHRKHQLQHNLLGPKKTICSYRESAWSQKIVVAILPHSTSLFCSNPALLYTSTTNLAIANRSRISCAHNTLTASTLTPVTLKSRLGVT